ncbi:MAG: DUF2905 domain-containing protein [Anaerolineae bacterium]
MPSLDMLGRVLLIVGGLLVAMGLLFMLGARIPFLGRLPGDIHWQRGNVSCWLPLATSLVLSLLFTVLLNVILRILRR